MHIKNRDLTTGSISRGLWAFAVPLMLGNVLQQFYNLADTWVVGKYIGDGALAAVGSSYTLLTFLTSVVIGLSLGTGSFVSMAFGRKQNDVIRSGIFMSAVLIGSVALVMTGLFYALLDPIISALLVPEEIVPDMRTYLSWVFIGFFATFLYNYVSNLLRSLGNSTVPLIFLGVSVVLNVGLDLLFVIPLGWGIAGAAAATVIAQYISGIGILFMMYGYYRAVNKPFMSVVLTVISLGIRVVLANVLSAVPEIGVFGIWISIPIGWFLADSAGAAYFALRERKRYSTAERVSGK